MKKHFILLLSLLVTFLGLLIWTIATTDFTNSPELRSYHPWKAAPYHHAIRYADVNIDFTYILTIWGGSLALLYLIVTALSHWGPLERKQKVVS